VVVLVVLETTKVQVLMLAELALHFIILLVAVVEVVLVQQLLAQRELVQTVHLVEVEEPIQ
jgi:hypothetical protein